MKFFLPRFKKKKTDYGGLVNNEHLMHLLPPEELIKNMVQNEKNAHPKTVLGNRDFLSRECKVKKGKMEKGFIETLKRHKLMIGDYGNVMWEVKKKNFCKKSERHQMRQIETHPYVEIKPMEIWEYEVDGFVKYEWDNKNHFYRETQFFDKNGSIYCLWKMKGNESEFLLVDPHTLKPVKTEVETGSAFITDWRRYIKSRFKKV